MLGPTLLAAILTLIATLEVRGRHELFIRRNRQILERRSMVEPLNLRVFAKPTRHIQIGDNHQEWCPVEPR